MFYVSFVEQITAYRQIQLYFCKALNLQVIFIFLKVYKK